MAVKIILILLCLIVALVAVVILLASVLKNKSRKIKLLQESLQRQKEIISEINGIKQQCVKKKKIISEGSDKQKFEKSVDTLKAQKLQEKKE